MMNVVGSCILFQQRNFFLHARCIHHHHRSIQPNTIWLLPLWYAGEIFVIRIRACSSKNYFSNTSSDNKTLCRITHDISIRTSRVMSRFFRFRPFKNGNRFLSNPMVYSIVVLAWVTLLLKNSLCLGRVSLGRDLKYCVGLSLIWKYLHARLSWIVSHPL